MRASPGDVFGWVAALALGLMVLIPVVEILARPLMGQGVDNASVLVQHLGLVMAMAGAVAAASRNELSTLLHTVEPTAVGRSARFDWRWSFSRLSLAASVLASAALARASWSFVVTEIEAGTALAYGVPVWTV